MSHLLVTRTFTRNPINELRHEMNHLIDDIWTTSPDLQRVEQQDWTPACDIEENDDHYLMALEMAGIPKDQITIECKDNQLSVTGERCREIPNTKSGGWYSERRFGKFHRSFTLPAGVNGDKIEANYRDGVLWLYLPKSETAKPRQIRISNGSGTGFFGKLLGRSTPKEKEGMHSSDDKIA